jgi:hypothetical protein
MTGSVALPAMLAGCVSLPDRLALDAAAGVARLERASETSGSP